jgi:hypothetical protein
LIRLVWRIARRMLMLLQLERVAVYVLEISLQGQKEIHRPPKYIQSNAKTFFNGIETEIAQIIAISDS